MFRVPNDDAMNANAFVRRGGKWNPDTHWIVSLAEENEAAFVQTLLDKYAAHVQAYSILPMWTDDTFVIELQFHDDTVGLQCEGEYLKAFRKGGIITDLKKSRRRKAT